MNPLLLKGSAAFVAVSGVVATGTYFSGVFSKDTSFRNYLKSIGRAEASSVEDWNRIKELYSKESSGPISGISRDSVSSDVGSITRWCEGKLKQNHSKLDEDLVETWCSKPVSIGERLSYFRLQALDVSEASSPANGDFSVWASKVSSYSQDTTSNSALKVKEITDSSGQKVESGEISSTIEQSKLKKWCGWAKDQTYQNKNTNLFKKYKHWCTKHWE